VNTVDRVHGRDWLPTADALRDWLADSDLEVDGTLGDAELRRAVELREALRSLAVSNNSSVPAPDSVATVNHVARAGGLTVALDHRGEVCFGCAAPGFDGALCTLLAIVFRSIQSGGWSRLKACPECEWLFYDYSRNRSGTWCSMQLCGNRMKGRAFRKRRSTAAAESGPKRR
jgi:predicted RNA-binding Zn ribbon-like protein